MKNKKVIVTSGEWKESISIDADIFEDYYAEACTRIVEKMAKSQKLLISAVMICYENTKEGKKLGTYNSYKILINAGLHKPAEVLRKCLYEKTKIDWAKEPIKSNL